jgi:hypothetical protein
MNVLSRMSSLKLTCRCFTASQPAQSEAAAASSRPAAITDTGAHWVRLHVCVQYCESLKNGDQQLCVLAGYTLCVLRAVVYTRTGLQRMAGSTRLGYRAPVRSCRRCRRQV